MDSLIVILLLVMPGVLGMTINRQCALKGSTVVLPCKSKFPLDHDSASFGWSKVLESEKGRVPLLNPPSDLNHFKYANDDVSDCSLQISDVQQRDEGSYSFILTTRPSATSRTDVVLSVKELTAVTTPAVAEGDFVHLSCLAGCGTRVTILWYRDGHPVPNPFFRAKRGDAGMYYCTMLGQETVRSASVALNVLYGPEQVTLSMGPSGDVLRGSSVTFTCSSDANPPVTQNRYGLYKDGRFVRSGQNHTVSDIQPSHSGLYSCQIWNNGIIKSAEVRLNVQYHPINISISLSPTRVVGGSSVNLTCTTAANPAADSFTWYRRTASSSPMVQVGSGQLLSIPSMEASHNGLYMCGARNILGKDNSTELLLAMEDEGQDNLPLLITVGVSLLVALVFTLLFWIKQKKNAEERVSKSDPTVFDFSLNRKHSETTEEQSNSVYVNIHPLPCSPPSVTDVSPHSQTGSPCKHNGLTAREDEVTYSTVTIKPTKTSSPPHVDSSRVLPSSQSNDDPVTYATIVKPS